MGFYFGPGPTTLPDEVKEQIKVGIDRCPDLPVGILECSHHSAFFQSYLRDLKQKMKVLLSIPDGYDIFFMPANSRSHYSLVPLNFYQAGLCCATYVYGHWSSLMADIASGLSSSVSVSEVVLDPSSLGGIDILHTVSNETVHGTSLSHPFSEAASVIIDATSDLCIRSFPIDAYDMVYAGMQKSLGVSGASVVIIKRSFMERAAKSLPQPQSYYVYHQQSSIVGTPAIFSIWVCGLMVDWLMKQGGLTLLSNRLLDRSRKIYAIISEHPMYRLRSIKHHDYSLQNICFDVVDGALEDFLTQANARGLYGLRGHAARGGVRLNLYHTVTEDAFMALLSFLSSYKVLSSVSQ
tara:strand:- start:200 stop:1252 length:1053 start_codon:yes stop_codon:yes gene_type:complete